MTAVKKLGITVLLVALIAAGVVFADLDQGGTPTHSGAQHAESTGYDLTGYEPAILLLFGATLLALARTARKRTSTGQ